MIEPKGPHNVSLYGCHMLIDRVRPEWGPNDRPRWTFALRNIDEPLDCLRYIVWIWRVRPSEDAHEMLEHGARNLADLAVLCDPLGVCGLLHVGIHRCRVRAGLHQCDFDTQLGKLVPQ